MFKLSNYVGQLPYSGLALILGFDMRLTGGKWPCQGIKDTCRPSGIQRLKIKSASNIRPFSFNIRCIIMPV